MNFLKFLLSKYFLKELIRSLIFIIVLLFGLYIYLNLTTNHNNYIKVPDLKGISFVNAVRILNEKNLSFIVIDSALYNPNYPKFSIVDQLPNQRISA